MKHWQRWFCLLVIATGAFPYGRTFASTGFFADKPSDRQKVSVQVKLSNDKVHSGSMLQALLIVHIEEGWHINSATPSEDNLIGTSIDVKKTNIVDSVDIRFPNGEEKQFDFSEQPLDVYEGTIQILISLRIRDGVKAGSYKFPATIEYQACSNNVCLAPASILLDIPIRVAAHDEPVHPMNKSLFDPYKETSK